MGHQFSGNHPFNGNQLNCSGGNRNAATSVEPGSRLVDHGVRGHLPHRRPAAALATRTSRERSLQEISTYTSSNQAAINEVQTASLRHFGGGNEVQVATFGPGFAPTATIQPLTRRDRRRAERDPARRRSTRPATPSRSRRAPPARRTRSSPATRHDLRRRERRLQRHVHGHLRARASRAFTVHEPDVRAPDVRRRHDHARTRRALTESGNTVTVSTVGGARPLGRRHRAIIAAPASRGYNGTLRRSPRCRRRARSQYTNPTAGLANSGGGTIDLQLAVPAPDRRQRLGRRSAASAPAYTNANIQTAINAIAGFAGTATVTRRRLDRLHGHVQRRLGRASTCRTSSSSNLSCGGCFASIEETNHGGANDSFTLNYNGNTSAPIMNGTNYTAAGILAALTPILPAGGTATVAGFGGGSVQQHGFQVTFAGTLAATNVPVMLALHELHRGRVRLRRRDRQGRRGRQQGRIDHADGQRDPGRDGAGRVHDPAADAVRPHRQRDRRRRRRADLLAGSRTTAAARPARRS